MIVQLHHLQAMLQLGVLPNPATGEPNPVNLVRAQHELALLEILQEKTKGNLDEEEKQILDEIVVTLRQHIAAL